MKTHVPGFMYSVIISLTTSANLPRVSSRRLQPAMYSGTYFRSPDCISVSELIELCFISVLFINWSIEGGAHRRGLYKCLF